MRLVNAEIGYFEDYEDDEVLEVGITGIDGVGTRRSFSIQRATCEPEEQDVQYGMDTYCVSTELGVTLYGCLRRVRLVGTVLTLEFTAEDAEILKIAGPVEVDLGAVDVSGLAARLRDVLEWGAAGKRPEVHVSAAQGPSAS